MRRRTWMLAGTMLVVALAARMQPSRNVAAISEQFIEAAMPISVLDYRFMAPSPGSMQSYRLDERIYKELQADSIVARVYRSNSSGVDVLVLSARQRGAFHTPQRCFSSQDWTIASSRPASVAAGQAVIPVTLLKMSNGVDDYSAAFCYWGPEGWRGTKEGLYRDWLLSELTQKGPPSGVFYRFLATTPDVSAKEMLLFAGEFLEQISKGSPGKLLGHQRPAGSSIPLLTSHE